MLAHCALIASLLLSAATYNTSTVTCTELPNPEPMATPEPLKAAPPQPSRLLSCAIGDYTVQIAAPSARYDAPFIQVALGERPVFSQQADNYFLLRDGLPLVTVADEDRDGSIDLLSYYVWEEAPSTSTTVMDRGFDGVADIRVVREPEDSRSTWWIWIENGWYQQVGPRKALVNGKPTEYQVKGGRFVFVDVAPE